MDQTFVYKDGVNLSLNVHSFLEKCLRISLPSCQSLTVDKTRWEVWIKFSRKILLCTRKKAFVHELSALFFQLSE